MYTTEFLFSGNGVSAASLLDTEDLPSHDDVVREITKGLRMRPEFSSSQVKVYMMTITESGKYHSQDEIFVTTDAQSKPMRFEQ